MARTRYKLEQLWHREQKIENLRHEKQKQRLAEMSQNANHGKGHARKVAKRVAHKHPTRISVVDEQRNGARYEWHDQVHREYVIILERAFILK